jgi:hypothetical protein
MKNKSQFILVVGLAFLIPLTSFGQQGRIAPGQMKQMHNEKMTDAFLPNEYDNKKTSPAYRYKSEDARQATASTIFTRQVNVNSSQQNIVGDAGNEPSIALNPLNADQVVIGWRQFDNVSSNFRQAGWSYTANGGQTWNFPGKIEAGIFRSDPVLDVDRNGNFFYNSLTNSPDYRCKVFESTNGGVTWNAGTDAQGGDKQWMTIDRTDGVGEGNIYSSWSSWYSTCEPGFFTRSTDGNNSYEDCIQVDGDPYWANMTVGNNGELYIGGGSGIYFDSLVVIKSLNAQIPSSTITWNSTVGVWMDGYVNYGLLINPVGLLGQVSIDVDHSTGPGRDNVYVLASVTRLSNPDSGDVMFSRSTDDGLTWSAPTKVNDDVSIENIQWFGTMSVAPNGRIDAVWLDTRDAPGTDSSALYYSYSSDQGTTWSVNEKLSAKFNPHVGYPNQNKMGDYFDMVSTNSGAHLAWANTLNGEQDVYYSFIVPPVATGMTTMAGNISFSVSPNPTSGALIIITGGSQSKMAIYNTIGEKVYSLTLINTKNEIDISGLPAGIYFLKIINEDGSAGVKKIIKE